MGYVIKVVEYDNGLMFLMEGSFKKPVTLEEIKEAIPVEDRENTVIIKYRMVDIRLLD